MRTTKTVSISMSPADLKVAERLARTTNRSLSGVLREGLKRMASEQYWQQVHTIARPKAEALGITEDDVTRLVGEYRAEKARQDRQDRQEKDQVTRIVVDSNVYISASLAECPKRSLISSKARTRWASTSHDRSWTRWPKCWPGSLTDWTAAELVGSCHPCGSDVVRPGRRGPLHRHWR